MKSFSLLLSSSSFCTVAVGREKELAVFLFLSQSLLLRPVLVRRANSNYVEQRANFSRQPLCES